MNCRFAPLFAVLGLGACSVGSTTVSLGGSQPLDGSSGSIANAGSSSGGGGALSNGGGLNLGDAGLDVPCENGKKTSLSGTVYDPAGRTALYNAVVYIPDGVGSLPPFKSTITCERCPEQVSAKRVALSGADGKFVLDDVPAGSFDLVVQLGKWRRRSSVTSVKPCQDNVLTDKDLTRLPRNQREGDLPKIALSTGHSDALECLLRKIGIDDAEFTTDAGAGRVNMFVGCVMDGGSAHGASRFVPSLGGQSFPSTNQLFDAGHLDSYDMVLFSCEGHKCDSIQTPSHVQQLVDYEDAGGRVFLDHNHYNWIKNANAPIKKAAQFASATADDPLTARIYTSTQANAAGMSAGFPKGDAFAQWLLNVHASTTLGELVIHGGQNSCNKLDPFRAQPWIYIPNYTASSDANFYFTIGTPVAQADDSAAPEACGRVVFTDLHVNQIESSDGAGSKDFSDEATPFPLGCVSSTVSPQEKALEFMIFDLSSCVQKETDLPTPPALR